MRKLFTRFGSTALVICIVAACGGSQPTGFTDDDDAGADATLDGSSSGDGHGGNGDSGGIILFGDAGKPPEAAPACTGIACNVKTCGGGGTTSVSGYVYAPNGTLPLYDVQVFIPNGPLAPFTKGVQCDQCGAPVSGDPITTALSDSTGYFTLKGVPSGANVPIVVQLGKWRREATIPIVHECTTNTLTDPNLTRLPKTQLEGSMPHIALTTGGCDQMGCMLPKIGIDPSEFGSQSDGFNKAVNVYTGSNTFGGDPTWTSAENLWGDPAGSLPSTGQGNLNTYDLAILSCECDEAAESKGTAGAPTFAWMTDYLNAGGRIFTTDFQYTWYKFSPDAMLGGGSLTMPDTGIGEIVGGAPGGGDPATLVTSFPKGAALAAWLKFVYSGLPLPSGVTFTGTAQDLMEAQMGEITPDSMFSNIQSLDPTTTVTWANSPDPTGPRVFTVDTPVGQPVAKQCGRGVHLDMHVDDFGDEVESGYPTTGCTTPLKPDEAVFAFFFFDLSSCIQNEMAPPQPPPVPTPQ